MLAGVLDLAWHELFGFEVDVESLLSPTHLLLRAAGLLMLGGADPFGGARMSAIVAPSWRRPVRS